MKPIAERALAAVLAQLKTILAIDGYQLDLGLQAHRSRHTFGPKELPALSLNETTEVPNDGSVSDEARTFKNSVGFEVVVHVPTGQVETGEKLGLGKADVKQALMSWAGNLDGSGRGVRDIDGQIGTLAYFGATAAPRVDGAVSESVSLRFVIALVEGFGNPYSKDRT